MRYSRMLRPACRAWRGGAALPALVAALFAGPAGAHGSPGSPVRVLGEIEFPTTTDYKSARQVLDSGMLLQAGDSAAAAERRLKDRR